MASIVTFEKISEDDSGVRYRFGFYSRGELTRTLRFPAGDDPRPVPEDGEADYPFMKAAGKIMHLRGETGAWPAAGEHVT